MTLFTTNVISDTWQCAEYASQRFSYILVWTFQRKKKQKGKAELFRFFLCKCVCTIITTCKCVCTIITKCKCACTIRTKCKCVCTIITKCKCVCTIITKCMCVCTIITKCKYVCTIIIKCKCVCTIITKSFWIDDFVFALKTATDSVKAWNYNSVAKQKQLF